MSYSIVYDKQFVKVDDKYLPFVLAGDNNCYEVTGRSPMRERRAREWQTWMHKTGEQFLYTEQEMLDYANEFRESAKSRNDEYEDSRFGWYTGLAIGGRHTTATTYGMYQGIFKGGAKYALTIEEIGTSVRFFTYNFDKSKPKPEFDGSASTTEELKELIDEALRFEAENGQTVYAKIYLDEEQPKRLRLKHFPSSAKSKVKKFIKQEDPHYMVYIEGHGHFTKLTSRTIKYSHYSSSGKRFEKQKDAEKQIQRIKNKFGDNYFKLKVEARNI